MKKPIKLSVIMPMYNSRDIKNNIKEAMHKLANIEPNYELVLVDDGSTNDSFDQAKSIKNSHLKVVGYKVNKGKGNAIKFGFGFVSGKYVAFVDSGRDIDPAQLSSFIKIMNKNNADIVIGSKRHEKSDVHYPVTRRVMSRIYQTLNHLLFNLDVRDTQVGLKLFKYEALEKIMPKVAVKRFAFDLELLVIAVKFGSKILEAPVKIRYKFNSTINIKAIFWILWDTAAIFYRDKILNYYD